MYTKAVYNYISELLYLLYIHVGRPSIGIPGIPDMNVTLLICLY